MPMIQSDDPAADSTCYSVFPGWFVGGQHLHLPSRFFCAFPVECLWPLRIRSFDLLGTLLPLKLYFVACVFEHLG